MVLILVLNLVHEAQPALVFLLYRLVQRLYLSPRLHGGRHLLLAGSDLPGDLLHRRLPPQGKRQALSGGSGLHSHLLQGTAHPDHSVIPKKSFYLPGYHGHGVG